MIVRFANHAGAAGRLTEDWAGAGGPVAVVLDGLSTPGGHSTGCVHGTPWFVRRLGAEILRASAEPGRPLTVALAVAIGRVADLHRGCDLVSTATPSAAVAIVRVATTHDAIDYLVLADVAVLVRESPGHTPSVITDRRVDDVAQLEAKQALAAPIGSAEHSAALTALVTAQREVRNTPSGYWIAGADPTVADHALTGRLPFPPGSEAALLTDGANAAIDTYQQLLPGAAIDLAASSGPEALIERARAAERTDPAGRRWPRFKVSDDATALYLRH